MSKAKKHKKQVKTNRSIEEFILGCKGLYAEKSWVIEQWEQYAFEVNMAAGDPTAVMDMIRERKRAQSPRIITQKSGVMDLNDEAWTAKNNPWRKQEIPPNSIAHLNLSGVMRSQSGLSTRGVNELVNDLNYAFAHGNISGVLLETKTGGGEATAGLLLKSALENAPKPVVVHAHLLASAGIMGTLPADEIIASGDLAQIGSIGTYVTFWKGFAKWYKKNYQDLYAGKSSNKNRAFRAMLEDNLQVMQNEVDEFNEIFLNDVKAYRDLKGDEADTLSGAMFDAKKARKRGLIHGIGGHQYALKRLNSLIKLRA